MQLWPSSGKIPNYNSLAACYKTIFVRTLRGLGHEEGADSPVLLRLVRCRKHNGGLGLVAVGDPRLGAVEHPAATSLLGGGGGSAGITAVTWGQWGFRYGTYS